MNNTKNITIDQGSTYVYTFNLTDKVGAPFDLTDFTARLQVRSTYGATAILIDATTQNGKLTILPGAVVFKLVPADTSAIKFNEKDDDTLDCVYDLEIVSALGDAYKPAKGTLTINREVTR